MERTPYSLINRIRNSDFGQTIAKTAAYLVAEELTSPQLERMKLPLGTGDTEEDYNWNRQNMHLLVPYGTIAAPIIEEALFRFIPSLITDKKKPSWKIGTTASVAFALSHNLNIDVHGNTTLETKKIPLYQFAAGMLLWHIMKKHGAINAIASHSIINGTMIVLEALKERKRK